MDETRDTWMGTPSDISSGTSTGPWTIAELAELAASLLSQAGPARPNGRVRDVPNERLIRWYATIGLLDPPLSRRGRIALYGRRHLLQLVAVKRRQSEGLSIAAIQAELAGATDAALQSVCALPADLLPTPAPPLAPASPVELLDSAAAPPIEPFWTRAG